MKRKSIALPTRRADVLLNSGIIEDSITHFIVEIIIYTFPCSECEILMVLKSTLIICILLITEDKIMA